jgi:hypothetical protein
MVLFWSRGVHHSLLVLVKTWKNYAAMSGTHVFIIIWIARYIEGMWFAKDRRNSNDRNVVHYWYSSFSRFGLSCSPEIKGTIHYSSVKILYSWSSWAIIKWYWIAHEVTSVFVLRLKKVTVNSLSLLEQGFWIGFIIALFVQDLIFGMLFSCISWENLVSCIHNKLSCTSTVLTRIRSQQIHD